jgi:nucleotide-binding universal stress UspA family protein
MEARTGIPAPEILHFASREGNDLIVLAHHPRKGSAEKAYIDSTTTQVCFEALARP